MATVKFMDRILEAYNGSMGVEFMRKTRERLRWICEQVSGKSVLDIGCSQGICPILLGQAGFNVLGMDINPEAIAVAKETLQKEEGSVRQAVEFVHGNFSTYSFDGRHFDTVIFGEVLEHLLRPEIFIAKAHSVLNANGRVVITVPFGINDDPDHKQTFYFSRIKRILYPYFDIRAVRYFGSWIGFFAIRRKEVAEFAPSNDFADLENVEQAVFGQERMLRDRISALMENSRRQSENLVAHRERTTKLATELSQCVRSKDDLAAAKATAEAEVARQREQLERAAAERAELAKAKAAVEAEAARQREQLERTAVECAELAKGKAAVEAEVARQREQLERAAAECAELAKGKAAVEEELIRQKTQCVKLEEGNRTLSDQLAELAKKANRAVSDYAKMKNWYQRVQQNYEKLSKAKLGRLTLWYWKLKDWIKARIKGVSCADRGVSVVIPTYTKIAWLDDAVKSVLSQRSPRCGVQVLVCVNGPDKNYYRELQNQYAGVNDVEVIYTSRMGANAGRNVGIKAAKKEFIAFLDSDDMFTPGYFKELLRHFNDPTVNIVVGRLEDLEVESGRREKKTYVNSAMSKLGMGVATVDKAAPFLASFCMKVYRTRFVRDQLGMLDEGERHTEDVLFWARNFNRITGKVFISNPDSAEAYVRRLTKNSLSRPSDLNRFGFFIVDRLAILDILQGILLDCARTIPHKDFVLSRIKAQTAIMKSFFDALDEDGKQKAREYIQNSRNLFLNQALFSDVEAIAFCHNFAPTVDASAFVATKRLRDICREEGGPLRWRVISQDMSKIRTADDMFKRYYADFAYAEHVVLHESFGFAPAAQVAFAKAAVEAAEKMPVAKVIYSRALFVGSHMAAYEYKKAHPEVKWYAEFSDPHAYGVDNEPRPCSGTPTWFDVEQLVYELADVILFTNQNQMEYMLAYNPNPGLNDSIRARAHVMHHPVLPHEYCKLVQSEYRLDDTKINVGFFGTFYVTRKCDDLLLLLANKKVVLHIFTTKPEDLKELVAKYGSQIRVNATIPQFEFLNLASHLDYLVLNDTEFPGEINPFLPSKYADYLVTGTPIIVKVQKGSVLSAEKNPKLIRIDAIDGRFASQLRKKCRS